MARQRAGGDPGGNRFGATLQSIKQNKPTTHTEAADGEEKPAEDPPKPTRAAAVTPKSAGRAQGAAAKKAPKRKTG